MPVNIEGLVAAALTVRPAVADDGRGGSRKAGHEQSGGSRPGAVPDCRHPFERRAFSGQSAVRGEALPHYSRDVSRQRCEDARRAKSARRSASRPILPAPAPSRSTRRWKWWPGRERGVGRHTLKTRATGQSVGRCVRQNRRQALASYNPQFPDSRAVDDCAEESCGFAAFALFSTG